MRQFSPSQQVYTEMGAMHSQGIQTKGKKAEIQPSEVDLNSSMLI